MRTYIKIRPLWMIVPCSWLGYMLGITEPFNVTDNIERSGVGTDRLQTRLRVTLGVVLLCAGIATLLAGCAGGIERLFPRRKSMLCFKCCEATKWIMVKLIFINICTCIVSSHTLLCCMYHMLSLSFSPTPYVKCSKGGILFCDCGLRLLGKHRRWSGC
jgi:hypothetical protein